MGSYEKYMETVRGHRVVVVTLKDKKQEYLSGHVLNGDIVYPAAGYLVDIVFQNLEKSLKNILEFFLKLDFWMLDDGLGITGFNARKTVYDRTSSFSKCEICEDYKTR